jgi:hypothetical protein
MKQESSFTPLSRIIESVLQIPLEAKEVQRLNPSGETLHQLSLAVKTYYSNFKIKPKEDWELRPYLASPGFGPFNPLGMDYVFGDRSAQPGQMTRNIKKYLLFCNSLCITDQLPYLLDYFEADPNSEYAAARIPAIKALLIEYTTLRELLEQGTLIPLSDEIFGLTQHLFISEEEKKQIDSTLRLTIDDATSIATSIRRQQVYSEKLDKHVDMFFPDSRFIPVFKELLRFSEAKFTHKEIQEPFKVGILGDISAINPDAVSIQEILKMRRNEEMFQEWRSFLENVFQKLYLHEDDYNDLDREYLEGVRTELLVWKDKLRRKRKESSFANQLLESAEKIIIGASAGAVIGQLTVGSLGAAIGAAGGALRPGLEGLRGLTRVVTARKGYITLRNHFLASGIEGKDI